MPEPMVNSLGRRKKEFTFILVSPLTFFYCLIVCNAASSKLGLPLCVLVAFTAVL